MADSSAYFQHLKERRLAAAGWDWMVTCYYADDVKPPKQPGELAIETVHKGDVSKDLEVKISEERTDIGRIDVVRLSHD